MPRPTDPLHQRAADTARLLRALGNASRLLILCRLFKHGEMSAGALAEELGLGLSALSQHLARMREEGLVSQRRQARQLFYRIDEHASAQLPAVLSGICGAGTASAADGDDAIDKPASTLGVVLGLALASSGTMAGDDFWQTPIIHTAGRIHELPQAAYQPDAKASYKVVFGLTAAAAKPDQINPGLQRVARTINLYAAAGVPLEHLHFVAIASGGATSLALDDAHYRKQFGVANPNLPVIGELRQAGVDVAVCGQAVAEHGYPFDGIDKRVTVALSALTTITELQQKGYALAPF